MTQGFTTPPCPPDIAEARSWIDRAVFDASCRAAASREDVLREVARDELPRRLRRLVDHPRMLRIAYRLRPRWRPTIVVGYDFGCDRFTFVETVRRSDGTMVVLPAVTIPRRR